MEELSMNIDFSKDSLLNLLDELLFYKNVDYFGEDARKMLDEFDSFLEEKGIGYTPGSDITDQTLNIVTTASKYSYTIGFTAGVQLFRSLMRL
ncbi:hypothetical protein QMP26_35605 [Enterocloster clostridioformis]|nr:hypothetical protein [uncultured Anaerostipes sp.]